VAAWASPASLSIGGREKPMSERGGEEQQARPQWTLAAATLAVAPHRLDAVERFYLDELGLPGGRDQGRLRVSVGTVPLTFAASASGAEPYYHFALLVPGNRFDAARDWLAARVSLLARPESGETTFDFDFWDARACYAHDPAGNILELIAHRGVGDSPGTGEFDGAELRGISELGIVTSELVAAQEALRAAGLELWYGEVSDERETLGFVGRQAHTLILCRPGRPWLPTGRPAEPHPLDVAIGSAGRPDVLARVRDGAVDVVDR
jgi:hypothetical protein